jgi:hypothetical protein
LRQRANLQAKFFALKSPLGKFPAGFFLSGAWVYLPVWRAQGKALVFLLFYDNLIAVWFS